MSDPDATQPTPKPVGPHSPGPTPTGYQRTGGGGFKWQPPSPEKLAQLLPQYHIEALIGRGGMGAVYKGTQKALERPVAIKILPPEVDDEDASYTERFKNEAKIMARLEHPAIVPVYDFGETSEGQLYFVMGFINGTDIHQMIQSQGRLPPEHALAITAHVCDALGYAHAHGVIHRDIKPSNILINMEGQVKVADFGLAKAHDTSQSSGLTKTGLAMGTPDYVAPETLSIGMVPDGRADLYAVGVMLYQMLTGQVPRGAFDLPSKLTGCDPRFDSIVIKAMKYDREDRYPTATDLRRDLDIILTAPMVQSGGQSSAAIPKQSLPQKPTGKPPQPRSDAGTPARKESPPAAQSARTTPKPPAKGKTPLFIGLGAAAAIGIGAFVMLGAKKVAKPSVPIAPSSGTSVATAPKPAPAPPKPVPATPSAPASQSPPLPVSKSPESQFPPGKWVKVLTKFEDLPENLRRPDSGVKFQDGWFVFEKTGVWSLEPGRLGANHAIRARIRQGKGVTNLQVRLGEPSLKHCYQMQEKGQKPMRGVKLMPQDNPGETLIEGNWPRPAAIAVHELGVVNNRLVARVDGSVLSSLHENQRLGTGVGLYCDKESFSDLEVINLDGLPEAEALKILGVDEKGNDLRQKPAAVASAASSSVLSGSSPSINVSPTGWQSLYSEVEWRRTDGAKREFKDGLVHLQNNGMRKAHSGADGAIRARVQIRDGTSGPGVVMRQNADKQAYSLAIGSDRNSVFLTCADSVRGSRKLGSLQLPKTIQPGDVVTLELRVKGDQIVGLFNGQLVADVRDGQLTNNGEWGIGAVDGWFESVEVQPFSAPAASSPSLPVSKSSSPAFPPGQWVKLFTKFEDLPEDLRKPDSGVKFEDGWWSSSGRNKGLFAGGSSQNWKNAGMRLRTRVDKQKVAVVAIRDIANRSYQTNFDVPMGKYQLRHFDGTTNPQTTLLGESQPGFSQLADNDESVLELAAVADRIIARVDSKLVVSARDQRLTAGRMQAYLISPVRDIEVINLDGLPEAEALRLLGVDEKGNDLRALAAQQEQQKAEQAKQADAMAAIPELKVLHDQLTQLTAERVTAPFEADVAKLNSGYLGGLERKIAEERGKGNLDGVLALEAEKKLIADKQPMPAEDNDTTPATLKDLRKIYRDAFTKLEATRAANLKLLTDPLTLRLKQLESTLTQANRIEHAKTVREYREGLGKEGSAGTPARTSPTGGAAAKMNEAGKSARAPLKKFPPSDDRKAAEWVLSVGGTIRIQGSDKMILDATDLPRGRFEVNGVYLEFTSTNRPRGPIENLLPLAGLKGLTRLNVKNVPMTEAHWEILPSLPSLQAFMAERTGVTDGVFAHLAATQIKILDLNYETSITGEGIEGLSAQKSLEKLSMYNFLPSEEGMRQLGKLETLRFLALSGSGSKLRDEHLPLLAGLKKLDSLLVRRSALTAEALAAMKQWSTLTTLGFDMKPGTTAAQVALLAKAFPKLETLSLEGEASWSYAAEDVSALTGFPKLKAISMTNSAISDEALAGVLALPKLESLRFSSCTKVTDAALENLGRHKSLTALSLEAMPNITDAGLPHLIGLKSLSRLELLRCPNLTSDAIAAFQKARPDVTVTR